MDTFMFLVVSAAHLLHDIYSQFLYDDPENDFGKSIIKNFLLFEDFGLVILI